VIVAEPLREGTAIYLLKMLVYVVHAMNIANMPKRGKTKKLKPRPQSLLEVIV
jgi:hypothetical protein